MSAGEEKIMLASTKFEIRDVWLMQPCSRDQMMDDI